MRPSPPQSKHGSLRHVLPTLYNSDMKDVPNWPTQYRTNQTNSHILKLYNWHVAGKGGVGRTIWGRGGRGLTTTKNALSFLRLLHTYLYKLIHYWYLHKYVTRFCGQDFLPIGGDVVVLCWLYRILEFVLSPCAGAAVPVPSATGVGTILSSVICPTTVPCWIDIRGGQGGKIGGFCAGIVNWRYSSDYWLIRRE